MHIRGHIDRCDGQFIEGWAFDADAPQQRLGLQILRGGTVIGECTADLRREDLVKAKLSDGSIAFSFKVPDFIPRNSTGDVRVRISGTDVDLRPQHQKNSQEETPPRIGSESDFGGLWIDRPDWIDRLAFKHRQGQIDDKSALQIFSFVRDGYLVIPSAVPPRVVAALNADIDRIWKRPPDGLLMETFEPDDKLKIVGCDLAYRAGRTKLLDLFTVSKAARQATAAVAPMRFLATIFEDTPKAFQQLAFWRGSQQAMHKDTAYVKIDSNPLALAATWLALEDVAPGTGELEYFIGSHHAPHFKFGGISKWVDALPSEHSRYLASLHEDAEKFGHRRGTFLGRAGDVLVWHADLAHGGSKITAKKRTRRSLVTHFTSAHDAPFYMRHARRKELATKNCLFSSQYADVA